MKKNYKCVVLMSAYNGEHYIEKQIDSILSQKGIELRLIIRDDGSKDQTPQILKRYEKRYPDTIQVFYGENVGIHKSFAALMQNAVRSEYIAFADQDDVWDKDKLYIAITKLNKLSADFYSSASRLADTELNDYGRTTSNPKLHRHYMMTKSSLLTPGTQGCTIVITEKLFQSLIEKGIPDYYGHDTWITVAAYYTCNCLYDKKPHMSYRQHDNSWTGNRKNRIRQLKREFLFFMAGMDRYTKLAKDILERYSDKLSLEDKKILVIMSDRNRTVKNKLTLFFDHKFRKYGILQNLFFKIFILFGKV